MSATEAQPAVQKQFGKGHRSVPHHSQKAKKWYPTSDVSQPKKARKTIREGKSRASLQPGAVLILLAGRFRGKRVVLLKHLKEGALLVTGPFKINGVPIRRVNARYVIATSTKVDLSGLDSKVLDKIAKPEYFAREKKSKKEKGEEAFLKQGEKAEKKQPTSERASDQKAIDKPLLSAIKNEEFLASYLRSSFSLRHGQRPHELKF
ncbi:large subunit ribosomal protein L6e [Exophiala aquamarina CBS 119918]|uniref:60S ribosomal protein L6 n=1 Tax=Exophiala aquamarina CBS 119918 TaxID=1182545 RepID=A0A072PMT6_9EURO|nr:large subunit ribosomal protein L6e [Exophiala aquamarina CBS 119918]KEF56815.1 large subunit ribosomal protein L6e [Exophiala aquamarina CBS 119918]